MWVWVALLVLTIVEVLVPEPQLVGLETVSGLRHFRSAHTAGGQPHLARAGQDVPGGLVLYAPGLGAAVHHLDRLARTVYFLVFFTIGLFPWPA